MTKELVILCTAAEIESLLDSRYGIIGYNIPDAEYFNYTVNSRLYFYINGKLDEYDAKAIEQILSGKCYDFCTKRLMNKLCAEGYLEAGKYVIDCSGNI